MGKHEVDMGETMLVVFCLLMENFRMMLCLADTQFIRGSERIQIFFLIQLS